jgi:signal transduction histidine kinase
MKRLLLLFYCIIIIFSAESQPGIKSHIQEYTTDNGLPSNGIKGMQWDEKTGFLWLATEAGIVRFNGVDFQSFTKENMPSIASERILFMIRNNAGSIYISDLEGNLFSVSRNKPVLWRMANQNNNPYNGNYTWLSVSEQFFISNANKPLTTRFSSVTDKVICLSDTSCLILNTGSLFYYSLSLSGPVLLPFENKKFTSIFKIGNQNYIAGADNKTYLLNAANQLLTPVTIADEWGKSLQENFNNGRLYWETGMENPVIIEGEKAWLLDVKEKNNITAKLLFTNMPSDAFIRSVQYSAKNSTLFIGTDSKGLIILNQTRVESKKRSNNNSKNRNSYYSQIELENGNILTNEGDIIGDNSVMQNPLPIAGKFAFNISNTNDSLLWYNQVDSRLGFNCLHRYNKITNQTKVYGKIIWGDIVAASGPFFYTANPKGIGIIDSDSLHFLYKYPEKLKGIITFDIQETNPGILAIATCGGLFRFTTATNRFDTIFSGENICVRSIWKYKEYVFFGTYGSGFYISKNGRIKAMPMDKNKYLLYTHCFIPDEEGYCWISTNRGLFKASLDEMINAFENNSTSVYYHYFGKKDGMEMTELNGGCTPCALQLKNKTLSFPSMDGLLLVNPKKAVPILPEGDIFIDEIQVDNKKINVDSMEGRNLPSNTNEIIIKPGFSAWCNKENIYLDYQLNDTVHWKAINTDKEAAIHLNNLPSGTYVLRIRKLNGFGINNYSYRQIRFTILTPWYKQWWFYLLCFLAIFGITANLFRFRTKQYLIRQYKLEKQVAEKTKELQEQNDILEKNNNIKTRLISIISHDIVTPLKFVTVAGKNLIEKRNLMSEALQQETIMEMTNTSQELQLLSTNILNWIKYQNENRRLAREQFSLYELVEQVRGVLNSLVKQKNLILQNSVKSDLEVYQFFEPLKILIYNLLTNAINFSEKGIITITAETENDQVIITVTDKGVGMTPEQIKNIMADQFIVSSANMDNRKGNGLGYLIIKDLVKMMGAKLSIKSDKGDGTSVSIAFGLSKSSVDKSSI